MMEEKTYWAVKDPDGKIVICTISCKKGDAIRDIEFWQSRIRAIKWTELYKRGFRLRQVYVVEKTAKANVASSESK
ncbi:hypothetical protein KKF61_07035 [Patescibacteria group bacterium]|nr:hypothetical protein [Patescibacteria group bacterium]